jgi:hypothetical protein
VLGAIGSAAVLIRVLVPEGTRKAGDVLTIGAGRLSRLPWLARRRHPGWAVLATLIAFLIPVVWHGDLDLVTTISYAVALVGIVSAVRTLAARRSGARVMERSWGPGLLLGMASGLVGVPWAPLPYVRTARRARTLVHAAGPLLLTGLAAAMVVQEWWFPVPLSRSIATAALIMAASSLPPLKPLDGAFLGKGTAALGFGAIALGLLVIFELY